jgi:hypothetical protein
VKYLLDTDHLSIFQRQTEPEYSTLLTRIAQYPPTDLACSIISFHEQSWAVIPILIRHAGLRMLYGGMECSPGYCRTSRRRWLSPSTQ